MAGLLLATFPMRENLAGRGAVRHWTLPLAADPADLHVLQHRPHGGTRLHVAFLEFARLALLLTLVSMQQDEQMMAKVLNFI